MNSLECDIVIAGGTAGGTAAALAAAANGAAVCLLEETQMLGGQLTSQGVCTPDEHRHIETFGGTRRYMQFRDAVREYYRREYVLTATARAEPYLNPGSCWVSRISFEPKVGALLLRGMSQAYEEAGRLRLLFGARVVSCVMDPAAPDKIAQVIAALADGSLLCITPKYVLDATDLGDLLPMCGIEGADWAVGAESAAETGEPDAPREPLRHWVQPFTFPFAVDWSPETAATNVIQPPADYTELKASQNYHIKHGAITGLFSGAMPWWRYRRVLASENFEDRRVPADLAMINTAGNDYYGGSIIGNEPDGSVVTGERASAALARARRASLGYLYWLQTECLRENEDLLTAPGGGLDPSTAGQAGYPEIRLRYDLFDTVDGCSQTPYIRESRRIRSVRPILEQEIVVKDFQGRICRGDRARAEFMPDSVGIGHYALDIHPNGHGEPSHFVATRAFQIPLGALVPVRLVNLLPSCKNLGVTHLTNGAYRLHPIEWNTGESAGLLAVWCVSRNATPRDVYTDPEKRSAFQAHLISEGIALHWYVDVPLNHPAFRAVQWLAGTGARLGSDEDLLFNPDDTVTEAEWQSWCRAIGVQESPVKKNCSRSQAALDLYRVRVDFGSNSTAS